MKTLPTLRAEIADEFKKEFDEMDMKMYFSKNDDGIFESFLSQAIDRAYEEGREDGYVEGHLEASKHCSEKNIPIALEEQRHKDFIGEDKEK